MKLISLLLCLFIGCSLPAFSQKSNWLITKLQRADSVILVSHDDSQETRSRELVDSVGNTVPFPPLVVAGRPNYTIVKERRSLTSGQRKELGKILTRRFNETTYTASQCFLPHHAIFITKNGQTSYLEICFYCQRHVTSEDLEDIPDFYNKKLRELWKYFKKLGFTYEMGE